MKNTKLRVNYLLSAQLVRSLYDGPSTTAELVENTGANYGTVLQYVRALKAAKLIRQKGKVQDTSGRFTVPLYEWGPDKKDIPHPKSNSSVRSARYRERKKIREIHQRLTLLGQGAGEHPAQEGGRGAPALDGRPHFGDVPLL